MCVGDTTREKVDEESAIEEGVAHDTFDLFYLTNTRQTHKRKGYVFID